MTLKTGEMLLARLEALVDENRAKVIFRECYKILNMIESCCRKSDFIT